VATTEADLIARIVEDPEDAAGFLVYADYLIERGDPRGELISLHADGRGSEAERHFAQHRADLLGSLIRHDGELALDWRLGFVRGARVVAIDTETALRLVTELVDAPACRFLRTLHVDVIANAGYHLIDARLAALARPQTLETISLGSADGHQPPGRASAVDSADAVDRDDRTGRHRPAKPQLVA
jgi:uncharacterized protein (TIGR02996 family)